jgi:hypothetical protein
VPFHVAETLNYRVTWASFATAASLQVSVPERRNLFGWTTWHFRASLHTQTPVRTLFTIDDEFDSYADAATLETHQYEGYLSELGRKDEFVQHFLLVGQAPTRPGAGREGAARHARPGGNSLRAARRRLAANA